MGGGNYSGVTEFILVGLTDSIQMRAVLFVLFLPIYVLSVTGNLGLIGLIGLSPRRHTPMYFFLSHLAFVDFCYTSSITPNMLVDLVVELKSISFLACAIQVCCFITFINVEIFLLALMAYDRYVAICHPLLYTTVMSWKLCTQLVAGTYLYCFLVGFFHTFLTFRFSYCDSNVINHFYCDEVPLLALSCSDTRIKERLIFAFAGFNTLGSLLIVLISYIFILLAILRIRSSEGRYKAFSTCASHLTSVTIFYGTIIFMYLQPKSNHSLDTDKIASVFYTIVIPMLNPLIYSLRNQEVKGALKKKIGKISSKSQERGHENRISGDSNSSRSFRNCQISHTWDLEGASSHNNSSHEKWGHGNGRRLMTVMEEG
ncbi:olfactory receptor 1038-like [Ornithorhynchus anatinus]|uniref:olfactory receptor 1038-like n=1 Tax=Ornithorhynchus anatinus TaxID=9258 RepID=UPI0010A77DF5|nr:olfactory receptor 1038-like [Ornithorhynchus anatinus]